MGGFAGFTSGLSNATKKAPQQPTQLPNLSTPVPTSAPAHAVALPSNLTGSPVGQIETQQAHPTALAWQAVQKHQADQALAKLKSGDVSNEDAMNAYKSLLAAHGPQAAAILKMHGLEVPPHVAAHAVTPVAIAQPAPPVAVQAQPTAIPSLVAPPTAPQPRQAVSLGLGQ